MVSSFANLLEEKKIYIRKEFNLLTTLFPYTNMAAVSLFRTSIWTPLRHVKTLGSLYVSEKLPTYPSSKPALTLTPHLGQNVGLRGRWAFFRMRIMIEMFYILILLHQLSPSLPFLSRQASARGRLLHQGRAPGKFFIGWVGAGGGVRSKIAHTVSTPCDCSWCKESRFYGLPFGHVVASMY